MNIQSIDSPLVSIKIASYNHSDYIGRAIRSVINQTYTNWELFIVDDASSDNSLEIINSFNDRRIKCIVNKHNIGAASSSLKVKNLLNGQYFCSLDSDDYWSHKKLEKQIKYLRSNPDVDVLVTNIQEVDKFDNISEKGNAAKWFNEPLDLQLIDNWVWQNRICHSSAIMKMRIHNQFWSYHTDLTYAPDWYNWVGMKIDGVKFSKLYEPLTYYRIHDSNLTYKNSKKMFFETVYISCKLINPYLINKKLFELLKNNIINLIKSDVYKSLNNDEKKLVLYLLFNFDNNRCDYNGIFTLRSNDNITIHFAQHLIDLLISKNLSPRIFHLLVILLIRYFKKH